MAQIILKVPNGLAAELADVLWQGGRPTDPPVPPALEPVALTDGECIRRWIVREVKGRIKQIRKEKAAKDASDALDTSALDGIE